MSAVVVCVGRECLQWCLLHKQTDTAARIAPCCMFCDMPSLHLLVSLLKDAFFCKCLSASV
jgi:hypothetical protein